MKVVLISFAIITLIINLYKNYINNNFKWYCRFRNTNNNSIYIRFNNYCRNYIKNNELGGEIMLLAILFIVLIVIGAISMHIYDNAYSGYDDFLFTIGITSLMIGIIGVAVCLGCLLSKTLAYKTFKIDYEVVSKMQTSSDDVRDATYTLQINEINKEILTCREYINSKWVGIYQNKKICEYELLEKEKSN